MRSFKCDGCGAPRDSEGKLIAVKLEIGGVTVATLHACSKQCLRTVGVSLAAGAAKGFLEDKSTATRPPPQQLPDRR